MKQVKKLESVKQEMFGQKILNSEIVMGGNHSCSCKSIDTVVGKQVVDVCTPEFTLVMNP
jgi:hypothetical protein